MGRVVQAWEGKTPSERREVRRTVDRFFEKMAESEPGREEDESLFT